MALKPSDLTNYIGTHLLPFTNPRVVCPPGTITPQGRPNIIVATPMRSGTHILIDMILNNIPAYRNRPLYVDLDQCRKQGNSENDLIGQVTPDAGYILKTHMPIGLQEGQPSDLRIQKIFDAGVVITIRRDRADVTRSLARWHHMASGADMSEYEAQYDTFWNFWDRRKRIHLDFTDLFASKKMASVLETLCADTGSTRAKRLTGPVSGTGKARIYTNKALTRLAGRHAPLVDTSIHTLKG